MEIIKNVEKDVATIALKGRLDTTTAPDFEKEMNSLLPVITHLTLDFKELEYLSSAGLRVILVLQRELSKKNGLVIINVNAMIMEIFNMTGFSSILTIK